MGSEMCIRDSNTAAPVRTQRSIVERARHKKKKKRKNKQKSNKKSKIQGDLNSIFWRPESSTLPLSQKNMYW